MWELCKVFQIV